MSSCLRGSPERAAGSGGEDVIKDVYRRHASSFFDELRSWFTKETRLLRTTAETQLEVDQLRSLRLRVEQLEENTVVQMPTFAGDVAAGSATSRSMSPTGRLAVDGQVCTSLDAASLRALCRKEARCALEELRGELLGGDLLCDELLSGGQGLRPALERLIAESPMARRESSLSAQIAELRASIDGATAAATAAATAEIGQLDNAFRASLASEVRELGSLCEGVRGRIEALDESAADHIGRLSARMAELEETISAPSKSGSIRTDASTAAPSKSGSIRTDASTAATVESAKDFTHSLGSAKEDVGFTGNVLWPGASFVDRSSMGNRQPTGNVPSSVEREEVPRAAPPLAWQPMQDELSHQSTLIKKSAPGQDALLEEIWSARPAATSTAIRDISPPPFCTGLTPLSIGSCTAKSSVPQAPSTPPKRHMPPSSATALRTSPDIRCQHVPSASATALRTSPGGGGNIGNTVVAGRNSVGGQKETQLINSKQWSSKSPLPKTPRMEARGGC